MNSIQADNPFECPICTINTVIPQDNIISCCAVGKLLCNSCLIKMNAENQVCCGKCPGCKRDFPTFILEHFASLKLANDVEYESEPESVSDDVQSADIEYDDVFLEDRVFLEYDDDVEYDDDDDDDNYFIADEVHFDRRILFPCRNHFGSNGRQFLSGCTDAHCQYSHVQIACRFGRNCQRRNSCLFSHPV